VDSRFKLINQSNQGLSAARNTGIKHLNHLYKPKRFIEQLSECF